ncbi:hypothetical protein Dimus_033982 [Dionaea muscipula]
MIKLIVLNLVYDVRVAEDQVVVICNSCCDCCHDCKGGAMEMEVEESKMEEEETQGRGSVDLLEGRPMDDSRVVGGQMGAILEILLFQQQFGIFLGPQHIMEQIEKMGDKSQEEYLGMGLRNFGPLVVDLGPVRLEEALGNQDGAITVNSSDIRLRDGLVTCLEVTKLAVP